ncbi:MAG: cyanophycinase [Planctomycetaceae bacterium]|nr:cyanophycinase [Planctomycetaceae bacterium]
MNICCWSLFCLLAQGGIVDERVQIANTGCLMICGGGRLPVSVTSEFVQRAGGESGHLVVIPTASTRTSSTELKSLQSLWRDRGLGRVSILHTTERNAADTSAFSAVLDDATAVWIGGGQQSRLASVYQGTATERRLREFVHAGGVLGGTSAGAAIMSRVMIASGNPKPQISEGFDLLPDAIIDQHFLRRNRFNRLLAAVRQHPNRMGVGIDEGTAVVFQAGQCRVMGESFVVVIRAGDSLQPFSVSTLRQGDSFEVTAPPR